MTPFAGVGVNVAMEDALHLARNIVAAKKDQWQTEDEKSAMATALKDYEADMFARAEEYAKQTWMYLGLFFHERGGIAMVEHFERTRAQEAAAAAALPTDENVEVAAPATQGLELHASGLGVHPSSIVTETGAHAT